eukprot:3136271-Pleurochrysis_carterae.AAC.2
MDEYCGAMLVVGNKTRFLRLPSFDRRLTWPELACAATDAQACNGYGRSERACRCLCTTCDGRCTRSAPPHRAVPRGVAAPHPTEAPSTAR